VNLSPSDNCQSGLLSALDHGDGAVAVKIDGNQDAPCLQRGKQAVDGIEPYGSVAWYSQ
jgi:hypothetical protein